ncbi:flavin reductase [Mesorhizobium sp. B2-7-3]|uniref:flavin reductase family protein n=1 Tax=Mesorhizobium sp. B2-7-3 TaxID=2589907 RepID=UPI0011263FD8|nr:flavin reductase family protein [Mesorhizobium sp. B2-7-3]TPJ18871.1 flavin reductase [Mesorhizobium sp. B2-7-3]
MSGDGCGRGGMCRIRISQGDVGQFVDPPLLSTDPASVLFCIRKAAHSYEALSRSSHCSIAILSDTDQAEAERFSSAQRFNERFDPSLWMREFGQLPEFENALISMVGSIERLIDAGTHDIFIVNITSIRRRNADPLVYFDRRYRTLNI